MGLRMGIKKQFLSPIPGGDHNVTTIIIKNKDETEKTKNDY